MPTFAYEAVDALGSRRRGRADAADAGTLASSLESSGLLVVRVEPEREGRSGSLFHFGRQRAVLEATRALSSLLAAGLPLAKALGTATRVTSGVVADDLERVRERVERGDMLADALARHPQTFPPLYVGLVRAGERSGDLAGAFARLTDQMERSERLRGSLLSASLYPMLLAFVGGVSVVVLMLFVIPRFAELLEGTGAALPGSTAFLLAVSEGVRTLWPLWAAAGALAALAVPWLVGTDAGRRWTTAVLLRVPVVRRVKRSAMAAGFARTTGTLLQGGAPLMSALGDAAQAAGDPRVREEALRIRSRIREGGAFHEAIVEGALFPPMLAGLVEVGEEASRLPDFLLKAAEIFEDATERTMQRLVALVEPAMIIVFGGLVALVALSLLQAIYGVNAETFL